MIAKLSEPVSGLMHLFAAAAAVVGVLLLLYLGRGNLSMQLALLVYGTSLVLMLSASAAYHLMLGTPSRDRLLRKLDHSAIYLLIAGTYTPICLYFFKGFWQWGIVIVIWAMALTGIVVKLVVLDAPRWITAAVYLVMGWMALLALPQILAAMPLPAIVWLILGGILFSIGAVVYVTRTPDWYPGVFGFHEVWHIFVILGCLCHYILIAVFVAPLAVS